MTHSIGGQAIRVLAKTFWADMVADEPDIVTSSAGLMRRARKFPALPLQVLILKVFAACDDFDSEKQPHAWSFPAPPAPPASSAVKGFGCGSVALRFKV